MKMVNLTPHEVRVIRDGLEDIVFPASGEVARLAQIELGSADHGFGVPFQMVQYGQLVQHVPHVEGTWYLVSLPTALGCPRGDFVFPYDEVRDSDGRIIGCRMLGRAV